MLTQIFGGLSLIALMPLLASLIRVLPDLIYRKKVNNRECVLQITEFYEQYNKSSAPHLVYALEEMISNRYGLPITLDDFETILKFPRSAEFLADYAANSSHVVFKDKKFKLKRPYKVFRPLKWHISSIEIWYYGLYLIFATLGLIIFDKIKPGSAISAYIISISFMVLALMFLFRGYKNRDARVFVEKVESANSN